MSSLDNAVPTRGIVGHVAHHSHVGREFGDCSSDGG